MNYNELHLAIKLEVEFIGTGIYDSEENRKLHIENKLKMEKYNDDNKLTNLSIMSWS